MILSLTNVNNKYKLITREILNAEIEKYPMAEIL